MANLGDCALRLTADWSRSKYENQEQILWIVGHEGGKADLRLKKEPDAEHQFRWVDPSDKPAMIALQMRGYVPVNKETWEKHPMLWEWNAEGLCFFGGQIALARPKEKWLADEAKRSAVNAKARKDSNAEIERAPDGLIPLDAEGRTVSRRKGI